MNKLTKLLSVFVIAGAMAGAGSALAGCSNKNDNNESGHAHNYTYVNDNNGKHHEHCDVDGCDAPDKTAVDHNYGNDNICDDCGYDKTPASVAVSSVTVKSAGDATVVNCGATLQFTATIDPANATDTTVVWSIEEGGSLATIDASTGLLTAGNAEGTVKVKATVGGKSASMTVSIEAPANVREISTVKDLLAFRQLSELSGEYKLMNDIDLEGVTLPAPKAVIADGVTFDGQGYTIQNALYADASSKEGILLKTITGGTVTNVKFLNCAITSANESAAIIAGECNGAATLSKIEFNACSASTTNNYVGLLFARREGSSAITINISEITVKNGSATSCAQYGGLLIGDITASTTVNFKNLDVDGEFKGSSGNGSFIAGRTRDGATVSVANAVISADMPTANSVGIFAGGGAAKLNISNVLITKTNNPALGASNKNHTVTKENVVAVTGVTVTDATASDGAETVAYLKDTLGFDFTDTWMEEGEGGYRLKAASTNVKSADAVITNIKANTNNVKVRFKVGETFSADGLIAMGVYSDGVQLILKETEGYTVDSSNVNMEEAGEYTVSVKSVENAEVKQEYTVVVAKETGFKVYDEFMTHIYLVNGTLDTSNLVVKSTWSDGLEEKVTNFTVVESSYNLAEAGKQSVWVTYGEYDKQTIDISVVATKPTVTENKVTVNVDASSAAVNGAVVSGVETFTSVVDAIRYLEACNFGKDVIKQVNVKAGTYKAKITTALDNLWLIGENTETEDKSVLTYSAVESTVDIVSGSQYGLKCATLHVTGEGFTAKNITIRNDFDYINDNKKEASPQGLALTIEGDKAYIVDSHLYGNQDTLYLKKGRVYFGNTLIEGNIDFIFGEQTGIAYFDECEIRSITKSEKQEKNNGYVTAMKADADSKPDYGYIFNKCDFTDDGKIAEGSMSLGRPWGAAATVAYINCSFTKAYSKLAYDGSAKSRWYDMSGNKPENADFCEYGSTGEGAITEEVAGGKILTAEKAANYTVENIFAMTNGKCTWTTPWAGTNEKVSLTVKNGTEDVYAGQVSKDIKLTAELAAEWFAVEEMNLTGLYTDDACTVAFDYATAISGTTVLYATYAEADPTIKEYTLYTYDKNAEAAPVKYGKIKFSGMVKNGDWLKFDAASEITFKAVKGTVITMTTYDANPFTINGTEVTPEENVATYTVTADGDVSIKRASGTTYIKTLEVNVPVSESKTIDLLAYDGSQVQGATKTWNGIEINATTGKFNNRGSDIQVNAGTVLKLLVAEGSTVKVIDYNGNDDAAKWTIAVENGVATLTATSNTYIKALEVTCPAKAKNYSVTVAEGATVIDGDDSNVTVAYLSKDGATTSGNKTDFKMDGNAATVTITVADAKAGQKITVKVSGFTGSTGNDSGVKVNATTNATEADTNAELVLPSTSTVSAQTEGTYEFTVTADGTVTIVFARSVSKTARIASLEITVA